MGSLSGLRAARCVSQPAQRGSTNFYNRQRRALALLFLSLDPPRKRAAMQSQLQDVAAQVLVFSQTAQMIIDVLGVDRQA
jgi:hypothetical protein